MGSGRLDETFDLIQQSASYGFSFPEIFSPLKNMTSLPSPESGRSLNRGFASSVIHWEEEQSPAYFSSFSCTAWRNQKMCELLSEFVQGGKKNTPS